MDRGPRPSLLAWPAETEEGVPLRPKSHPADTPPLGHLPRFGLVTPEAKERGGKPWREKEGWAGIKAHRSPRQGPSEAISTCMTTGVLRGGRTSRVSAAGGADMAPLST